MSKVICFTHTDLDGAGVSSIFAKTKGLEFECYRCNYGDINDTVMRVLEETPIGDIADKILTNHPELDILMIMSFPRSISLRTQKQLDIPLGDLAKLLTGSGGGHPRSAGATISKRKMTKLLKQGVASFSNEKVTIKSLED